MLTFRTHPLARVRPESVPPAIMGEDAEKFALMEELGVKAVLSLEFSSRLASMSRKSLLGTCSSAGGSDCRGRGLAFWPRQGRECRNPAPAVLPLRVPGDSRSSYSAGRERISSTRIREAVRGADFLQVAGMLGRPYRWKGPVIHGRQLGRLLDYPRPI